MRFEREALITARLQHPAVVPIFDVGEIPARGPYAMSSSRECLSIAPSNRPERSRRGWGSCRTW